MIALVAKIVLAYLLGSFSGSLLVGKLRKVDIREQGSGNAGGTNAFRTQGWGFALFVVIIDVGKGFLAAWWIPGLQLGDALSTVSPGVLVMLCGFAAVIGHCFPVWHGFRPCSPDGLPYLGRFNHLDNLSVATGHTMMGLSLGPITGRLMAEMLSGKPPSIDIQLLDPNRY